MVKLIALSLTLQMTSLVKYQVHYASIHLRIQPSQSEFICVTVLLVEL